MAPGVATYYDRLLRWNRIAGAFGYGGGSEVLTVHRALADPRVGGRPTFTRLHDVVLERLPAIAAPRVLDAGCGLGGTMLALAAALDATCIGVTLSAAQAEVANSAAVRRGVAPQVRALVGSYDAPPAGPFDLIVAIESLVHSADPGASVAALACVLAPGGLMLVVDDMPEPTAEARPDLVTYKRGWHCPVVWSHHAYRAALARENLDLVVDDDLTPACRPRGDLRIRLLMALNRLLNPMMPPAMRQVMTAHLGGLALERLIRGGHVRYRLMIARRPELQVS